MAISPRRTVDTILDATGNEALEALDLMDDIIIILDRRWRYVFLNQHAWQVLKRPSNKVLGHNIWKVMPHLPGTQFEKAAKQAMKTGQRTVIEEFYPGSQKFYRTKFYPTQSYLTLQIIDITDLIRAKQVSSQLMGDLHDAMEIYWSDENRSLRKKHDELETA